MHFEHEAADHANEKNKSALIIFSEIRPQRKRYMGKKVENDKEIKMQLLLKSGDSHDTICTHIHMHTSLQ